MIDIKIIKNEIFLCATSPFTVIHMSDLHLTEFADDDEPRIKELAIKRRNTYPFSEHILSDIENLTGDIDGMLLITGDMTDFISKGNHKKVAEFAVNNNFIFLTGNHDFRDYRGVQYDVEASRNNNISKVQILYKNDIRFFSKETYGVNIVCVDNCYYRFEKWELERLKEEVSKGLPIILAIHVPFYTEDLYNLQITADRKYASLVGVPEEKMTMYPEERYIQQIEDSETREFIEYIYSEKSIKLVISGHLHKNYETNLPSGIKQLVTDKDTARIITIN